MNDEDFASILRHLPAAVVVRDDEGRVRFVNDQGNALFGAVEDRFVGHRPDVAGLQFVDTEGRALAAHELPTSQCHRTGLVVRDRIVGFTPHGATARLWHSVTATPWPGRPGWVIATSMDVTDEVESSLRTRQASDARESRFQRVIDALPGVIFQLRTQGERRGFTYLAGNVREVVGVSHVALMKQPSAVDFHADDRAQIRAALQTAEATAGEPATTDFRVKRDGAWRWVRMNCVATRGDGVSLFTGFLMDVSEQHDMQERIQRSQRLDAMASLAAGVAHNFNNMLGAVLPNLEGVMERAPADLKPELSEAHEAAASASTLVHRLLQAVRGEPVSARRLVDVGQAATSVAAICRGAFGPEVRLTVSLPDEPAFVRSSPELIQQVILNLCINGRDASVDRQSPTVDVAVACLPDQVVVRVQDNGHGMSEGTLKHLGEPFFTTKPPGEGTGLGLATVYGLVADMGGEVHVESRLDEGAVFSIALPRVSTTAGGFEQPSVPPTDPVAGRILLVDDERLVRTALSRALGRSGHEVVEASNGTEALARLDDSFDAVLLDLSMPGLSGAATLSRIKERFPLLPVAIVTGHLDPQAGVDGADAIMRKPVGRQALDRFLAKVL